MTGPQQSLLTSPKGDNLPYGRKMKRSDYRTIPHRWFQVLTLHLCGKRPKDIQNETGYSPAMIYRILDHPDVLDVRQQILKYYDQEFEALFPQIIEAIRKGLQSPDRYLEAVEKWTRLSGKGTASAQKDSKGLNVTAENVAMIILQNAREQSNDSSNDEIIDIPTFKVYDPKDK